jgi:hypothetical protein
MMLFEARDNIRAFPTAAVGGTFQKYGSLLTRTRKGRQPCSKPHFEAQQAALLLKNHQLHSWKLIDCDKFA